MSQQQERSPRASISEASWYDEHPQVQAAISCAMRSAMSAQPAEPLPYIVNELVSHIIDTGSSSNISILRSALCDLATAQSRLTRALHDLLPTEATTSRAGYLKSLPEILGPCPSRSWTEEWSAMLFELKCSNGELVLQDGASEGGSGQGEGVWVTSRDFNWSGKLVEKGTVVDKAWVEEHESIAILSAKKDEWLGKSIENTVAMGWTREEAQIMNLLLVPRKQISNALERRDTCYAASTYALCEVFASKCTLQEKEGRRRGLVYRTLLGETSLAQDDPAWASLETPDATGFCGVCSLGVVRAGASPKRFTPEGLMAWSVLEQQYIPVDSPVVAFESHPEDELGFHAAVILESKVGEKDEFEGVFPPNCLYRLKRVEEGGFTAPGGLFVKQKLLVVTATYRSPIPVSSGGTGSGSKLCAAAITLNYGNRAVFIDGFDALVPSKPPLTMAMEFQREGYTWSDWCGVEYSLQQEWAYVNGPAVTKEGCTAGTRDSGDNNGKTIEDFCSRAKERIEQRRREGCGVAMPESSAFLSRDEVLAVRLYSGPSYLPINNYLRQIAACTGSHRQALASHPLHTFAATCRHLANAVRKLSAVATPEEQTSCLYRGVRGELNRSFWVPDSQGLICAVDTAFMSCSRSRGTPVSYMSATGPNVLWELHPAPESDAAFHCGADISFLSQFPAEEEVLFPPCTMLTVRKKVDAAADDSAVKPISAHACAEHEAEGKGNEAEAATVTTAATEETGSNYFVISVQPGFV